MWPMCNYAALPILAAGAGLALLFSWTLLALAGGEWREAPLPIVSHPAHEIARDTHRLHSSIADAALVESDGLLAFVRQVRRSHVPGGHYLALKAYDFCTREARLTLDALSHGSEPVADGRQLDAQARLARLCAGFRERTEAMDYYLLAEEGLQQHDFRLVTSRRLERLSSHWDSTSRDEESARRQLMSEVLSGGDAWLIRDLAAELEVVLHTGCMKVGGEIVPAREAADVVDAIRLIACEQGSACSREGEWQQLLACAGAGECDGGAWLNHPGAWKWQRRIREALAAGSGIDVEPVGEQRF